MNFDIFNYPYSSKRNVVLSNNAMAITSNPYAANAAINIMKKGGNAIDGAVAMATCLSVVEPTSNGIGSDTFAIIYYKDKIYGLNSSGKSPELLSYESLVKKGFKSIEPYGVTSINTPGAPRAWSTLIENFGNLSLTTVMEESICLARDGYVIEPNVAILWENEFKKYLKYKDKKEFKPWFDYFTKDDRAYRSCEIFKNNDLANTLESIANTNAKSFYEGDIAEKIDYFIKKFDGFLRYEDLKNHKSDWVIPIKLNYRGYDIWELPPNTQGIIVLMALNILNEFDLKSRDDIDTIHTQIEALKLAFTDGREYISDINRMNVSIDELLSKKYALSRKSLISDNAILPTCGNPKESSTVYCTCADKDGNMVSLIQSNYHGFGSGIVIPETCITLNNRASNFLFDKKHCNGVKGSVRSYHTIIPGFITKNNKALASFGVMGGFMQPQGHLQILNNLIDFNLNPQSSLDAPRWQWIKDKTIEIEQDYPNHIVNSLIQKGHKVKLTSDYTDMGRGQILYRTEDGIYIGGTEKRCDGYIAMY